MHPKPTECLEWIWGKAKELRHDRKLRRFILYALVADGIGYSLVYVLTSQDVLGSFWANTTVSKGMAPLGLVLNTLAITGRILPGWRQGSKWVLCWLPTAIAGTIILSFVVKFGLKSFESRAIAGVMIFPLDYFIKRFFVFARQPRLELFFFKQKLTLVFGGYLLLRKIALYQQTIELRITETA